MKIYSTSFAHGQAIPPEFAFGRRGDNGEPCVLSTNRNPHLAWEGVPEGAQSLVLICVDPDAPTCADDVNKPDRMVPALLRRAEFFHWIRVNIPIDGSLAEGAYSDGITAGGKTNTDGVEGLNDYTAWFAGDAEMAGQYHGYDGPCPPFNDTIPHRYVFRLFALDTHLEGLPASFTAADVFAAMHGHVLAEAATYGTYSLNPSVG